MPESEWMPAFRQPTPYEREIIAQKWNAQLRKRYRANNGKVVVGIGVAGLILLLLDVIVAPTVLPDKLILLAGVISCFSAGRRIRASVKRVENMFAALDRGAFCVLPVTAQSVRYNREYPIYEGFVRVSLDNGSCAEYRYPLADAKQKQSNREENFPVFLVKLEGENEILAVSVP